MPKKSCSCQMKLVRQANVEQNARSCFFLPLRVISSWENMNRKKNYFRWNGRRRMRAVMKVKGIEMFSCLNPFTAMDPTGGIHHIFRREWRKSTIFVCFSIRSLHLNYYLLCLTILSTTDCTVWFFSLKKPRQSNLSQSKRNRFTFFALALLASFGCCCLIFI